MTEKLRYTWNQKDWYFNIGNYCIDYRHMGECVLDLYHMVNKCRIDRVGGFSKIWSWRL